MRQIQSRKLQIFYTGKEQSKEAKFLANDVEDSRLQPTFFQTSKSEIQNQTNHTTNKQTNL